MSKQSLATGLWNSVKQNATDPFLIGGIATGASIGIYESTIPNVEGSFAELATIGAITGLGAGLIAKSWWNHDTVGVPWLGRGYV